jgi:hypothetical protein
VYYHTHPSQLLFTQRQLIKLIVNYAIVWSFLDKKGVPIHIISYTLTRMQISIVQFAIILYPEFLALLVYTPVRIRVRIDSPHPLVCRKRRLNGAVLRMRPEKPRSRVTAGVAR